MKIAGSGSNSQRHGSADPDPNQHKNVMDLQHCSATVKNRKRREGKREKRRYFFLLEVKEKRQQD